MLIREFGCSYLCLVFMLYRYQDNHGLVKLLESIPSISILWNNLMNFGGKPFFECLVEFSDESITRNLETRPFLFHLLICSFFFFLGSGVKILMTAYISILIINLF